MSTTAPLVWFITGASSGFGSSLALHALRSGHQAICAVRSPASATRSNPDITKLGGKWVELDVNKDQATVNAQVAAAVELFGRLDVVVNNAGYCILGALEDIGDEEAHAQMETNFFGPMRVIRAALPTLRKQMSGTIVNISSGAGIHGRPTCSLYAGSKFALEGMSESLSRELTPFNIRVIIVQPGAFATNFMNTATWPQQPPVDPTTHISPPYQKGPVGETMEWMANLGQGFQNKNKPAGGSVEKASQRIFEAVTGTGMAEGLVVGEAFRLPLGKDCVARWEQKIEGMKKNFEVTRAIAESTEY